VSVARFIADQRTFYRVPYAVCCAILGFGVSWLHKWLDRPATVRQRRRAELDAEVLRLFVESKRTYDSPRIHADLDLLAPASAATRQRRRREASPVTSLPGSPSRPRRTGRPATRLRRRSGLTRHEIPARCDYRVIHQAIGVLRDPCRLRASQPSRAVYRPPASRQAGCWSRNLITVARSGYAKAPESPGFKGLFTVAGGRI
jgi:hypothetical protein